MTIGVTVMDSIRFGSTKASSGTQRLGQEDSKADGGKEELHRCCLLVVVVVVWLLFIELVDCGKRMGTNMHSIGVNRHDTASPCFVVVEKISARSIPAQHQPRQQRGEICGGIGQKLHVVMTTPSTKE